MLESQRYDKIFCGGVHIFQEPTGVVVAVIDLVSVSLVFLLVPFVLLPLYVFLLLLVVVVVVLVVVVVVVVLVLDLVLVVVFWCLFVEDKNLQRIIKYV